MSEVNNFVKDLQVQCLNDSAEFVTEFRNSLFELPKNSHAALAQILKQSHNLKGNLQAVGFAHCAEFVHELETNVSKIQELTTKGNFCDEDAQILEFFLSDCLQALEMYFNELRTSFLDSIEYKESKKYTLKMIANWKPGKDIIGKVAAEETPDPHANFIIDWPEKLAQKTEEVINVEIENLENSKGAEIIPIKNEVIQESLHEVTVPAIAEQIAPKKEVLSKEVLADLKKYKSDQFLLCKNHGRYFAIPIDSVIEIVRSKKITQMPAKRENMLGLINLRGEALPVLNLSSVLNINSKSGKPNENEAKYILVCKINENIFCFGMEEANEVISLDEKTFQPAKNLSINSESASNLVSNYSLLNEKMIMILDLERTLVA